jgi:SulP family sulfate permease
MELVAQGFGNIGSALFGGIPATGTIARTATNIRSGARSPISGMLHAVFVLVFMVVAAPLASFIPLAGLAGVLVVIAWNMAEKREFAILMRTSWSDAVVLLATFGLTIFHSLTMGILVGFSLSALIFIHRMSQATGIEEHVPAIPEDVADTDRRPPYDAALATNPDFVVYRITGAFFFGAASMIGSVLDRIDSRHRACIIDFGAVPLIDSTAANAIGGVVRKAHHRGVAVLVSSASADVERMLVAHGVASPLVQFTASLEKAIRSARSLTAQPSPS